MLKPENRLKKVRDFNLLLTRGSWIKGGFFDLNYAELAKISQLCPKNEDLEDFVGQLKIAFAVGLKMSKKAVKRNCLRRVMRESVRLLIKDGVVKSGYYALLVARPGSLELSFDQVEAEVKSLFKKAKMLK